MVRAAAYARYSSNMQREESIEAQIHYIYEYAEKRNIVIVKEYIDRGISGKKAEDRVSFMEMIKDAKTGMFDIVLVHKSNRFARNREEAVIYKHKLKKYGIKVIAVSQDFGEGPHTVIMEALMEGLDEFYSLELAEETMKGLLANASKCKYNGGHVLYGYKINNEKFYEIEPEEAKVVQEIYDRFCEGYSYAQIQSYLIKKGIVNRKGENFSRSSICEILRNEKYKGVYIFNKIPRRNIAGKRNNRIKKPDSEIIKIEGGMPAIISPDKWQKVQDILNRRKKQNHPIPKKQDYLLTGFIKCGKCGSSYVGYSTKKPYYACTRKKNRRDCNNKNISKELVENTVINELNNMIKEISIDKIFESMKNYYEQYNKETKMKQEKLAKEISLINKKINNLLDFIAEGVATTEVKEKLKEYTAQKERLETYLSESKMHIPKISKEKIIDLIKNINPMDKTIEQKKAIFNRLGLEVIIYENNYQLFLKKISVSEYNLHVASPTPLEMKRGELSPRFMLS